jgi:hypothetical protein
MNYEQSKEIYKKYIDDHRANVKKAWDMFRIKLKGYKYLDNDFITNAIDTHINNHDLSKYGEDEFEPYRQKWYAYDGETTDEAIYESAWQHHKDNNPHHWEHWFNPKTQAFKLPNYGEAEKFTYLVEMLCDWIAMGMKDGNDDAMKWYQTNKDIVRLPNGEQEMVEEMLNLYYSGDDNES